MNGRAGGHRSGPDRPAGVRLRAGAAAAVVVGLVAIAVAVPAVTDPAGIPEGASGGRTPSGGRTASDGRTAPAAADPGPPGPADGLRRTRPCSPPGPAGPGVAPGLAMGAGGPVPDGLATGAGQLVAVIDTGVAAVPRLAGRLRGGGDYLTGGYGLEDCDGHGTDVAVLLAGAADPATGTGAGAAPGAAVVSLRQSSGRYAVTGPDGAERPAGDIRTLAAAIHRGVALGASVINVSEVVCVPTERLADAGAPLADAVRSAEAAGVLVVAAAGNINPVGTCTGDPGLRPLPALYDGVLAVGAVDARDRPAPFSVSGPWVDVAAPGVDLPAPTGPDGAVVSGTSYAVPLVAGTAALLRERFPMLTPRQVADRIRATARPPAAGRDDRVGDGVLDPAVALTAEPLLLTPGARAAAPASGRAGLPEPVARPTDLTPAVAVGIVACLGGAVAAALAALRRRPRP
ncbi:type VII secretion-associated serine protease mycosin [Pseudonocardia nantongensis]|uniref:type VII secretion-associated serine protease mycosin n=1 Tax=Pseudonocardia nantongensis TaxID=1181885 RepID=UPI00397DC31A